MLAFRYPLQLTKSLFFNVSNEERAPRAVKDVLETLGGLIYHDEDCHFSNCFAKHGKDFDIEVAINNYLGIQEMLVYLSQFISNILNNRIFLVFDCRRLLE